MQEKLNWGIIGTGAIAKTFARALTHSTTGRLVAVASRAKNTADDFAREFQVDRAYPNYLSMLEDQSIHAVYIAPPHPFHAEWAIRAADHKKHVLVEKPMAINAADAMAMIEAATRNKTFLMEAFMYRCHPQTARLLQLLSEKTIGDVRAVQATFSFRATFDPNKRLFRNDLAGGSILDVGCYPVSMARLIAGADPIDVKGSAVLGQTGVDECAAATLKFPNGIVAQVATGINVNQDNVVRIFGTEGSITLPNPWVANRQAAEEGRIAIYRRGETQPDKLTIEAAHTSFTYEADVAGHAILAGKTQADAPAMTWNDSLGNLRTLDQWRESIALEYAIEKPPQFRTTTVGGAPLSRQDNSRMKYGKIEGVAIPMSRLIMGCDNQRTFAHSAVLFDDFFERGGNVFDTAWVYGGGLQEKLLGQWINHRNLRKQIALIAKGAHTPLCTPRDLVRQLSESLDRIATDYADLYLMHRDNTDVPVSEFIDVMNEQLQAGKIRTFGVSNWSLDRVEQANAYAAKSNKKPISVLSNQLSLARMLDPIWKGCISVGDRDSRRWLEKTQLPLLAWSSQSRGFFVEGRAHPDKKEDAELTRVWYSPDNFDRLARAKELAKKKSVLPIHIALAYVLAQPFPAFALIGPRSLEETRSSFDGLKVELTEQERRWVNLEE